MHPGVLKLQIKLVRAPSILDLYIDLKQVFEHGKLASELWLVLPWAIVGFMVNALVLMLPS